MDHSEPVQTRHWRAPDGSGYQPDGTVLVLELTTPASHRTNAGRQRARLLNPICALSAGAGYGRNVITVVTPIAAQTFDPHATSAIGDGT